MDNWVRKKLDRLRQKVSSRAGLRHIRRALRQLDGVNPESAGYAEALQRINAQAQRYAEGGAIKRTPLGSQVRHIGQGGEGLATLTTGATVAPGGGLSVRKVFDTNRSARTKKEVSNLDWFTPGSRRQGGSLYSDEDVARKFQNYRRWVSTDHRRSPSPEIYASRIGGRDSQFIKDHLGMYHRRFLGLGPYTARDAFSHGAATAPVTRHLGVDNLHLPDLYSRNLQRTERGLPYYHTQYTPGNPTNISSGQVSIPLPVTKPRVRDRSGQKVTRRAKAEPMIIDDVHRHNVLRSQTPSGEPRNYLVDFTVDPAWATVPAVAGRRRVRAHAAKTTMKRYHDAGYDAVNRRQHIFDSFRRRARE